MKYISFEEEEKHDIILQYLKAQEKDHFVHNLNKTRYEDMLTTLPEGSFRTRIQGLLDETNSRLIEVEAIIESTKKDLPSAGVITAALDRLKTKEING